MGANEQLFAHLIGHLYKECNQEVALSFIEFLQFKQRIIKDLDGSITISAASSNATDQQPQQEAYSTRYLKLWYPNVPKSIIVYKERAGLSMNEKHRAIAHELYERYLTLGSVYELNVSYEQRNKLKDIDDTNWDLNNYDFVEVLDD